MAATAASDIPGATPITGDKVIRRTNPIMEAELSDRDGGSLTQYRRKNAIFFCVVIVVCLHRPLDVLSGCVAALFFSKSVFGRRLKLPTSRNVRKKVVCAPPPIVARV